MGGLNPGGAPFTGVLGSGVDLILTAGVGKITTTANGILKLVPNGSGIVQVGDLGSTSHTLNTNDDLFVAGRGEFDGVLYADANIVVGTTVGDANGYWGLRYVADDGFHVSLGAGEGSANGNLIITFFANWAKDHDHDVASPDPTLIGHSRTDPDTVNTQYWYITHNMVDAVRGTGLGGFIDAPASGNLWKANGTYPASKNYAEKMIHQIIALATDSATTAVGVTPNGRVTGVGLRVSTQIAGLDAADHSISLGIAGTTNKYGTVSQGAADAFISVNKKFHGQGGDSAERAALIITIGGGADQIPTSGAVEIEIHFTEMSALADV